MSAKIGNGDNLDRELYILDTNAILYNPDVIHDLPESEIVLPQVVLHELDKIKMSSSDRDLRFRARRATRFLFDLAQRGSLTDGITLDNGSIIRIALFNPNQDYPDNLSIRKSDDKILAIAYQVANDSKRQATLVTNDLNMLVKAQLLGLRIQRFVEAPATFLEKLGNRLKLRKRFKNTYPFLVVLIIGAFAVYMGMQVLNAGSPQSDLPPELQAQYELFKVKEEEYKRIIAEDPKNYEALVGLGNLYFDNKQYQEAVDYYRKALKINPNEPNVRTDMAICYFYLGLNDLAASELEKVISQYPDHAKAHYNLGIVYKRMGRLREAVKQFDEFLQLVPYGPDAQFALNQKNQILLQLQQNNQPPGAETQSEGGT